jgi:hypothetical protein
MAGSTVNRIPQLDVQFAQGSAYDPVKLQRMVQALTTVISNVNTQSAQIAAIAAEETTGVTEHVLATESGLGPAHTVSGLIPGNVLIAVTKTSAEFAALKFSQIAQVDPNTFLAPAQGDVITFIDGYWSAMPQNPLDLSDPGQNALVAWNEAAQTYTWAIPDSSLIFAGGTLSVNQGDINHANLQGLEFTVASGGTVIANDHPQYALLSAVNTWALPQTFSEGLTSNADIDLVGNIEQSGQEVEWRIQNTDDTANEGTWRIHAEPGQLIFSTVSDDGSDGENWLSVTRVAELADAVNIQSNSFSFNGSQVWATGYVQQGANIYFTADAFGNPVINAANPGSGGGGASPANPTGTVGLSAVNGVLTTYMRSDAAPPLSQSISPTMTGNWIFQPTSGLAVEILAAAGTNLLELTDGTVAGVFVTVAASSLNFGTTTNHAVVLETDGTARWIIAADGGLYANAVTGGDEGAGTINASAYFQKGSRLSFIKGAGWSSSSGSVPVSAVTPVDIIIPYNCTLQEVYIATQGGTGSCTVDVWKTTFPGPPTSGNDITGGTPPAISAGTSYSNTTLSGWTTTCNQGDIISLTLASNATFTVVEIQLRFQ